ncbi:MAG: ASCH domain-containing protein [Bacilli bacterium]
MRTFEMKLWNDSFISIKKRFKTIEMRLNDEKRKLINIGDVIEFINTSTNEVLKAKVINIYKYKDFYELYANHNKISIGYEEHEIADPKDMLQYYKQEDINKYGVLGIEIGII